MSASFLDLTCGASSFMSDTSYTTKKLGQCAEKNRKFAYIIMLRGCERSDSKIPHLMKLHLNTFSQNTE
jgi:hypothetical protein